MLYVEASLPLQPCECHLLRSLLNEKIARGREASHPPTSPGGPVLSVVPALEWSESGFAIGWQVPRMPCLMLWLPRALTADPGWRLCCRPWARAACSSSVSTGCPGVASSAAGSRAAGSTGCPEGASG